MWVVVWNLVYKYPFSKIYYVLHLPSWDLTSTGNLRQPGDFSIRINNFNVSYEKDVFVRDNSFNETSK